MLAIRIFPYWLNSLLKEVDVRVVFHGAGSFAMLVDSPKLLNTIDCGYWDEAFIEVLFGGLVLIPEFEFCA